MENEKAKVPPEVSSGEEAHLTEGRQARQDDFSQSGSVCLDELQDLAHRCVQPGADAKEGLLKIVYAYGAAENGKYSGRTPLIRKFLELGSATAAGDKTGIPERTARAHIADFKAFAILLLKEIHAQKSLSEEARRAAEEERANKARLQQREFDAAWSQCKSQCPGNDTYGEAPTSSGSNTPIHRTGCTTCPLNPFWALNYDRALERAQQKKDRGNAYYKAFGRKAFDEASGLPDGQDLG